MRQFHRLAVIISLITTWAASAEPPTLAELEGAWRHVDTGELMHITDGRCVSVHDGRTTVFTMSLGPVHATRISAYNGEPLPGEVTRDGDDLVVAYPERADGFGGGRFERLDEVPDAVSLKPMTLGTRVMDDAEREALAIEFVERQRKEQDVRHRLSTLMMEAEQAGKLNSPEDHQAFMQEEPMQRLISEMMEVDGENTARVLELMGDVGWLSRDIYGQQISMAAFLIVQHSSDLRLMLTVLPLVEAEAKSDPQMGQLYALLYDRTQLALGEKQRYGTQIGSDADGVMKVSRVENVEELDARRAEMGMPPIAEYLKRFGSDNIEIEG